MNCLVILQSLFASTLASKLKQLAKRQLLSINSHRTPISSHPQNNLLKLNVNYHEISNRSYYDAGGNGNCLFYSLLYTIYNHLQNPNSLIRQRFLNLDYFKMKNKKVTVTESEMIILRNQVIGIIDCGKSFKNLSSSELNILNTYIRRVIYAYMQHYFLINEINLDSATLEQDEELINKPNSLGSDEYAIHFANFLQINIRIFYASSDVGSKDTRLKNGLSNYNQGGAGQGPKRSSEWIYIIRINNHFQAVA